MSFTKKSRSSTVVLLLILSSVTSYAVSSAVGAKPTLPNIVFILADDMSYDSVSILNDQIGEMQTPQIDRLAKEGMIFDDAHSASSVCTPTRYGILTGRYAWRSELKNEVVWSYGKPLIEDDRLTMGEMLQDKGYQTAIVGKWHLGMGWPDQDGGMANRDLKIKDKFWGRDKAGIQRISDCEQNIDLKGKIKSPRAFGFDYYFGVDLPNFPPYCWIENDHLTGHPTKGLPRAELRKHKELNDTHGIIEKGWKFDRILPKLAEKSVEYINDAATKDKPYFLYLSLTSPHSPIAPSAAFRGKSGISAYADFVLETDWVVGQVLDAIEASGKADNTLIIFSTDNGTSWDCNFEELKSHGVNLHNHFRGHKGQIYDGGHRIPLMVKWPKHVKAGRRNGEPVCLNDFFATFAEIIDYKIQDDQAEDSYSILPLITGESEVLSGHPMVVHHNYDGKFSIRNKRWKLIFPLKEGETLVLFDMVNDVKETRNVADQHPEIVTELTAAMKKIISDGRSTEGEVQQNFKGQASWYGTP